MENPLSPMAPFANAFQAPNSSQLPSNYQLLICFFPSITNIFCLHSNSLSDSKVQQTDMKDRERSGSSGSHPTSLLQNTSVPHLFIYMQLFYQSKNSKTPTYFTKLLDSFTSSWISNRVSNRIGGLSHPMGQSALIIQNAYSIRE